MRSILTKTILFVLLAIPYCVFADANSLDKKIKEKVTAFIQENNVPGVAIQLIENGNAHSYFFGYANIEKKLPVTKYTIFEIGSISKVMTNLIFAQQIDYAKMQFDTPLSTYFPNLPEEVSKIRLQDLATHTSGVPFTTSEAIHSRSELQAYLSKWRPEHSVRERWIYSNFGIGLLGQALEIATHRDFNQLYKSRILNPLGMQNIGLTVPKKLQRFYAQGYDKDGKPVPASELDVFANAYGIKSSASDMQHFLSAAIGLPGTPVRILYPMRITQASYFKIGNKAQGLGWEIHALNEKTKPALLNAAKEANLGPRPISETLERPLYQPGALIDKTGASKGFRAYIAVVPNKKSGIVFLTNKNIDNQKLLKIAREILFDAMDLKPTES